MTDKNADLAGPGRGNYDDLSRKLPEDYEPLLSPKETMQSALCSQELYRGESVQRTQPANGSSTPDR